MVNKFLLLIIILLTSFDEVFSQAVTVDGGNTAEQQSVDLLTGDGDASFTGDLSLNLPILAIPGRNGLDYNINLTYNSAIMAKEPASWVGLGFNLVIGSISRSVVNRVDEQLIQMFDDPVNHPDWNLAYTNDYSEPEEYDCTSEENGILWGNSNWNEEWDSYYLNLPQGSDRIVPISQEDLYSPNNFSVRFLTQNYKPWRIDYNVNEDGYPFNDHLTMTDFIPNFRVILEDGTRYIFTKVSSLEVSGNNSSSQGTPFLGALSYVSRSI